MEQMENFLLKSYEKLSATGDPLERLNAVMDWKIFEQLIDKAFKRERKSSAGRRPYNRLMMFKVLILQALYNLSDNRMEFQIRDRLSFMRFLGIKMEDEMPDEKTIWAYREVLIQGRVLQKLFDKFGNFLERKGYGASSGSIVDASIVEVPKQRNGRNENEKIKNGEIPKCITENENRARQKDVEARWTIKNGKAYFGYKVHVNTDVKNKLIRKFKITTSTVSDISCLDDLLDEKNLDKRLWADSAYYSGEMEKHLQDTGYISRVIYKHKNRHPEWSDRDRENQRRSKIRKRVEHIFGFMQNSMGGKFIRTIGLIRAIGKISLMNITYNICRFEQLHRLGAA
jgi:IS5 family transposase